MSEITADKTLDARGLQCPMPVVKTTQEIKTIEVGQVLEVLATDPGSKPDLQAWCKYTGHKLLEMKSGDGLFQFFIRRTD
jgi:tRNA 2-thiouridine synthesizing protein A